MMINRIVLVGRLVRDPELRHTQSGKSVCSFVLACDRGFKDASGKALTDFIPIVVWGKLGEVCCQYLGKGKLAGVDGRMQQKNYEKDGVKHYTFEVVAEMVKFLTPVGGESTYSVNDGPFDDGFGEMATGDDLPF